MDPYAVLGVAPGATDAEMREAYLRRSKELHPDRFADASADEQALATRAMQQLNVAYAELRDGPPAEPAAMPSPPAQVWVRPAPKRGRWFWPLVLVGVMTFCTLLALVTGSSLNPPPPQPDATEDLTVLEGECITLDDVTRELEDVVECTRPHDARVVKVVEHGTACPVYIEQRMESAKQDLCLDDS